MAIGTADIFEADYSTAAGPNWTSQLGEGSPDTNYHTQTREAGGGPHGLDAYQVAFIPGVANNLWSTGTQVQPYSGHHKSGLSNPSTGTSRFYRWYEYHNSDNNYRAYRSDEDNDFYVGVVHKRLGIGEGTGNRMILNIGASNRGDSLPRPSVIFDDGSNANGPTFSLGAWHAFQVEVRYDGSSSFVKIWIDNDTYASPDVNYSPGTSPTNTAPGDVKFGYYSNDTLHETGVWTYKDAAFRVATTFDTLWNDWLVNGDGVDAPVANIGPPFLL